MWELLKPLVELIIAKLIELINLNGFIIPIIIALLIAVIFFGFGWGVHWVLTEKKLHADIASTEVKIISDKIEVKKKINEYRDNYQKTLDLWQLSLKLLTYEIKTRDINHLVTYRQEVNDIFFNKFLPAYSAYIDAFEIANNSRSQKHYIIDAEILRLFPTIVQYIKVVNNSLLLQKTEKPPITISWESLLFAISFVDRNISFLDLKRRRRLSKNLNALGLADISFYGLIRHYK